MKLNTVTFQLCTDPDGEGTTLEFLDKKGNPFMEIGVTPDDVHEVRLYTSSEPMYFPLSELIKGIEIAKERVKNIPL